MVVKSRDREELFFIIKMPSFFSFLPKTSTMVVLLFGRKKKKKPNKKPFRVTLGPKQIIFQNKRAPSVGPIISFKIRPVNKRAVQCAGLKRVIVC